MSTTYAATQIRNFQVDWLVNKLALPLAECCEKSMETLYLKLRTIVDIRHSYSIFKRQNKRKNKGKNCKFRVIFIFGGKLASLLVLFQWYYKRKLHSFVLTMLRN